MNPNTAPTEDIMESKMTRYTREQIAEIQATLSERGYYAIRQMLGDIDNLLDALIACDICLEDVFPGPKAAKELIRELLKEIRG